MQHLLNRIPSPPDRAPALRDVFDQIWSIPLLLPIRLFWNNLYTMRDWWPVLAPFLLWQLWRSYRRERKALRRS